jgi:hypothetical protein
MRADLAGELKLFDKIDLKGLEDVKLQNRIDVKYIFHINELLELLKSIKRDYFLLEIDDMFSFQYETVYYDSKEFYLYHAHHNGKLNRFKIRRRHYLYNNQNFFEIKQKIKGSRTQKYRIEKSGNGNNFSDIEKEMLHLSGAPKIVLEEKLKVFYTRLTMAAKNKNERITIDLGLQYENEEQKINLNELIILEVKQNSMRRDSVVINYLKSKRIRPLSVSKYAIGIALTEKRVKKNAFKPKILQINKLLINA